MQRYRYIQHAAQRTARANPRAVLGFMLAAGLLLAGMLYAWIFQQSNNPYLTGDVSRQAVLHEDVEALVVVYGRRKRGGMIDQALMQLTGSAEHDAVVVTPQGGLQGVASERITDYGDHLSRPAWWFMPNVIGAAYVREGGRVHTVPLRAGKRTVRFHVQGTQSATLSQIPINALAGTVIRCEGTCPLSGITFPGMTTVEGDMNIFLLEDQHILITAEAREGDAVMSVIKKHAQFSNPTTQSKQLPDGTTYDELIPDATLEWVGDSRTMLQIGGEALTWTMQEQDGQWFATTHNDPQSLLSTLTWTNNVCGVRYSSFTTLDNKLGLADNAQTTWSIGVSGSDVVLCKD